MKWPFKTIKKTSTWPMQPFVVQFAAAVLDAPLDARQAFSVKMIERCVRMGARLAVEFGMDADAFVTVAAEQISRESTVAASDVAIFGGSNAAEA